ncbi:MAG: DUF2298 domain-containing protein, partial [Chloroflexota bacterium]
RVRGSLAQVARVFLGYPGRDGRAQRLYALLVRCPSLAYEALWPGLALLVAILLALALAKGWVAVLAIPILLLAALFVLGRHTPPERRLVMLLIAVGVALTLGVEYVVLRGDIGRMNTVFKFYLQVWIFWGIAGGVALAALSRRQAAWTGGGGALWRTCLGVLLVSAALYPLTASLGKIRDRWDPRLPPSLDGIQYMTTARYHDNNRELVLEYDRQAIFWMQDHIAGSPVIAEANTPLYRWGNRISIYTGLPTIIGWDWHQKQQRAAVSGQVVDWRLQDLRDLYNTQDVEQALAILRRYHVGYIYVGQLEQAYYDAQGLSKFDAMVGAHLAVAYQNGPVTIYRVLDSDAREVGAALSGERGAAPAGEQRGAKAWIAHLWVAHLWVAQHWVPATVRAEEPEKRPSGNLLGSRGERAPLMLDRPVEELPVLRDRGWNRWASGSPWAAAAVWWLALQAIGLCAWPIARRILPAARDGGHAVAKGLGLLLLSYLVWLGASLRVAANSPPVVAALLLLMGAVSFFLWRRRRHATSPAASLSWRRVLGQEALFTAAFLAFVGIRLLNPDLWQPWFGGEKMMEIAFLNAVTKSAYMPPYDPYFAGGVINYYYYGYLLVSTLIKLTGLPPEVAFNLAVPTFFALTALHVYALGRALRPDGRMVRPLAAGLVSVALVAAVGNLTAAPQVIEQFARAGGATFSDPTAFWADLGRLAAGVPAVLAGEAQLPPFDYWYRATRVI